MRRQRSSSPSCSECRCRDGDPSRRRLRATRSTKAIPSANRSNDERLRRARRRGATNRQVRRALAEFRGRTVSVACEAGLQVRADDGDSTPHRSPRAMPRLCLVVAVSCAVARVARARRTPRRRRAQSARLRRAPRTTGRSFTLGARDEHPASTRARTSRWRFAVGGHPYVRLRQAPADRLLGNRLAPRAAQAVSVLRRRTRRCSR